MFIAVKKNIFNETFEMVFGVCAFITWPYKCICIDKIYFIIYTV